MNNNTFDKEKESHDDYEYIIYLEDGLNFIEKRKVEKDE